MTSSRAAASRVLALALIAAASGGCGLAGALAPGGDPAAAGPLDAVPPVVQVLGGVGPTGAYRVSVYRTRTGDYCVELATGPSSGTSCASEPASIGGPGVTFEDGGTWITGGTDRPGAVEARVGLPDGSIVSTRELSAPTGVVPGMRFFVLVLPAAVRPPTLQVVNETGAVIEEWPLD
jgi:hypothetical protein